MAEKKCSVLNNNHSQLITNNNIITKINTFIND